MKRTILAISWLLLATSSKAAIITVDDDGPAHFRTIQAAINASIDGDIIVVRPGTYTGPGNRDIDFLGKAITVRSTDPNDPNIVSTTIIDCNIPGGGHPTHPGFYPPPISSRPSLGSGNGVSVLAGFTITNGSASYGGGIFCAIGNSAILNCVITKNAAAHRGGGIYCTSSSNVRIENCTISDNVLTDPDTSIKIMPPYETLNGHGAGIYSNGDLEVINCRITNNSTPLGVNACGLSVGRLGPGGGICCKGVQNRIVNSIIKGNIAANGAGIFSRENATITNCTIIGNFEGPAIAGSATVINSIIWANEIVLTPYLVQIRYSIVQYPTQEPGNIISDPKLTVDFHLRADSPCVDAGDPNYDPTGDTDIDGELYGSSGRVDIGADEFIDTDSDNLPDFWEERYFGSQSGANPLADTDHDGYNNLDEYQSYSSHPTVASKTYYVDANQYDNSGDGLSWATAKKTIQAGIDATHNGDKIIVADGIYTGQGNRNLNFEGKPIILASQGGPEDCIIDCAATEEEPHRAFNFHNLENTTSVVDGFTIRNGVAPLQIIGYFDYQPGGAIYCRSSSPTVTNCIIADNRAGSGGGIWWECVSPVISKCTFANNFAFNGGAIAASNHFAGSSVVTDCNITNNLAYYGGAIDCSANFLSQQPQEIRNCTITDNIALEDGGAVMSIAASPQISNCTITGNVALGRGGAFCCRIYGLPTIRNSILWFNRADQGPEIALYRPSSFPPVLTISFSDVQGGQEAVSVDPNCTLEWGPGNIAVDPCFVSHGYWADVNDPNIVVEPNDPNAVWINGDYHLLEDSPCIDTGDPNYVAEPNETDLDGKPRIIGGRIDMGAYEYCPPVPAEVRIVPRTINLASKGKWITALLRLPEDYNVANIDSNSVLLEDEIEAELLWVDEQEQVAMVRFSRSEVQGILSIGDVELTISGELTDGTVFEGTDVISVIDKGGGKSA